MCLSKTNSFNSLWIEVSNLRFVDELDVVERLSLFYLSNHCLLLQFSSISLSLSLSPLSLPLFLSLPLPLSPSLSVSLSLSLYFFLLLSFLLSLELSVHISTSSSKFPFILLRPAVVYRSTEMRERRKKQKKLQHRCRTKTTKLRWQNFFVCFNIQKIFKFWNTFLNYIKKVISFKNMLIIIFTQNYY